MLCDYSDFKCLKRLWLMLWLAILAYCIILNNNTIEYLGKIQYRIQYDLVS